MKIWVSCWLGDLKGEREKLGQHIGNSLESYQLPKKEIKITMKNKNNYKEREPILIEKIYKLPIYDGEINSINSQNNAKYEKGNK